MLALFYWLESVSPDSEDENLMRVAPAARLRLSYLRNLEDDKLLAIAQFLVHERLSEEQFAQVFRTSTIDAQRELAYLESLSLVERTASGEDYFRINPVLYRHASDAVRERNII